VQVALGMVPESKGGEMAGKVGERTRRKQIDLLLDLAGLSRTELAHGNCNTRKTQTAEGIGDVTGGCGGFEEIGCILVMAGHSVRVCGEEGEDDADPCFVRDTGGGDRDVGAQIGMGDFRRAPRESAGGGVTQREQDSCAAHSLRVCGVSPSRRACCAGLPCGRGWAAGAGRGGALALMRIVSGRIRDADDRNFPACWQD
jgi:hypothetical protein